MSEKREFVDYIEDSGKVAIAVKDSDETKSFVLEFDDYESIEKFVKENDDLPQDIRDSLFAEQLAINKTPPVPQMTASEAKYSISARHVELENMIVAGTKPTQAYFAELAKKDIEDYAKLDAQGRQAVKPDMANAVSLSKEYAAAVKSIEVVSVAESGLGGESLDAIRKRLSENFATPHKDEESNGFLVKRTGGELPKEAFVKPVVLVRDYDEVGLEFRLKKNSMHFRLSENGNSLHTTTPDKKIVADMVALAKAKQWGNIKLTGSQEFRREAWLQAESQGIKTTGYTPKSEDKAHLEAIKAQREVNSISNIGVQESSKIAPRTDSKVSESTLQQNYKLNVADNLLELSSRLEYKGRNVDELTKIAELRSFLQEDMKQAGGTIGSMADTLKRFDKHFEDPRNLEAIVKESESLHDLKLPAKKSQEQEIGM